MRSPDDPTPDAVGGDALGEDADDDAVGFSLEELAAKTGLPARTIRFYRQSGLIAAPERDGRRVRYDTNHLERLETIAELRDRGFGLDAIAEILDDPGGARATLPRVLQMSDELRRPWIEDRETTMTRLELLELLGTTNADIIETLEKWEIATPTKSAPQTYHVPSVALLELLGELLAAGIHEELAYASYQAIGRHIENLARELVEVYTSGAATALAAEITMEELGTAFRQLRPIALQAVQLVFAHEIESAVAAFVEQGGIMTIRTRDVEG